MVGMECPEIIKIVIPQIGVPSIRDLSDHLFDQALFASSLPTVLGVTEISKFGGERLPFHRSINEGVFLGGRESL